jgi:glycine/D-amino acid oxidase-like deaminating enzyme
VSALQERYKHVIYWRDTEEVEPRPALAGEVSCDVCVVGGGYTGLWTAYQLHKAEPALDIHVLEAEFAGCGASGHNDGFVTPTIGKDIEKLVADHGLERAAEASRAVGRSILEIGRFCRQHQVDAEYEPNDYLLVAVNAAQRRRLERDRALAGRLAGNDGPDILDGGAARELIGSPAIRAAIRTGGALINPHKLARGLARVVEGQGTTISEYTPVTRIERHGAGWRVVAPGGTVTAERVVVAANAYQGAFRQFRRQVMPTWSYAMVSEPLTDEQLARVPWPGREGLVEAQTFLRCCRFTADNRLLWGGGRAYYRYGGDMADRHMDAPNVYRDLRSSFLKFFPDWKDVRFSHAYGGAVAITRDFVPHFGTAAPGLHYGYGYCGNGIAATHLGGKVLRDLVLGKDSEWSRLLFVNRDERSCPPEPFAFVGAKAMTRLIEWKDGR